MDIVGYGLTTIGVGYIIDIKRDAILLNQLKTHPLNVVIFEHLAIELVESPLLLHP
jgi:hypothetical protein